MQLITLLETAGRELLALQKVVGDNALSAGGAANFASGFASGGTGRSGIGSFGSFGGGVAGITADVTGAGGAASRGLEGGGALHRDVVRLCAVMEITSVLLCTLSMALSQVRVGRSFHGCDIAAYVFMCFVDKSVQKGLV